MALVVALLLAFFVLDSPWNVQAVKDEYLKYLHGVEPVTCAFILFDGEPVGETELMPILLEAGFLAGPRRAVLRP